MTQWFDSSGLYLIYPTVRIKHVTEENTIFLNPTADTKYLTKQIYYCDRLFFPYLYSKFKPAEWHTW